MLSRPYWAAVFVMFKAQIVMARQPRGRSAAPDLGDDCEMSCQAIAIPFPLPSPESFLTFDGEWVSAHVVYVFCVEGYPSKVKTSATYNRYSILSTAPHLDKKQGITKEKDNLSSSGQTFSVYLLTIPAYKKLRDDPDIKEVFYDDFTRIFNA